MAALNGYQQLPGAESHFSEDTPPGEGQKNSAGVHQRTYQACIPCRKRKVRCDLGSVDNPHDPPCMRCRRESKECYFSATRRKRKSTGPNGSGAISDDDDIDVFEIRDGRKRVRVAATANSGADDEEQPRTPGGSIARLQPLRRPAASKATQYGEEDEKASEQTAAILQGAEVHSGHDALKVLYEAAVRSRSYSKENMEKPNISGVSPSSRAAVTSPLTNNYGQGTYTTGVLPMYQNGPRWTAHAEKTPSASLSEVIISETAAYAAAVKAWSRFRFVRAGWFTPREAIDYIQYFYKYLAPLTPVALPDFRPYETHEKLLTHEPMLTVTMLLVASRHMKLEGPGAVSRPYSIHQKLWNYLSGMIDRIVWGQERFGGGFCGAGAEPGADVSPLTRKGLRTLGTVESLVLLTEWHPRAMHFPPDEADEELMVPDDRFATPDIVDQNEVPKGIGGQRMDAWLEPCWRSDRMCWMLLGISMSLAFEIGVFDASDWQRHARSIDGHPLSAGELQTYDRRRGSVRDLLTIYVSQTSGRLGLTSMLPGNYSKPEDSETYKRQLGQHHSIQETVLHFWLRIAAIMREGNQKVFANKAYTRDLIKNGNYKAMLENLQRPLEEWQNDFDNCAVVPKYMRCILQIEYEYARVYLNSLALQAVAERCANDSLPLHDLPTEMAINAASAITTNGVRTDVAIAPQTLAKWLGGDRKYMIGVGDAARNLLKVVVDGLHPGEYLKHAPVRTYFRIVSVAIILLKSFSLGASESDVADSLTLMDRTVEALRTCIVDDVHVASRFADLLDTLTQSLKPRLVRVSADGRGGRSQRVSHQGSPTAVSTNLGAAHQRHQQYSSTPSSMPGQPQWSYSRSTNLQPSSLNSSDPLYGISNDTYDLMGNDFSVMPPPSFGLQSPPTDAINTTTAGGSSSTFDPYTSSSAFGHDHMQDWLALPLDPLINMSGADVNQTMYGPELGGQDMLELLLNGNSANGFG